MVYICHLGSCGGMNYFFIWKSVFVKHLNAEPTTAVLPIWPDQWPTDHSDQWPSDHPDAQIHSGSVARPGHRHKQGTGSNPGQVTLNPRWRWRFNIHSQDSPDWWQAFPVNCKGVLLAVEQGIGEKCFKKFLRQWSLRWKACTTSTRWTWRCGITGPSRISHMQVCINYIVAV